MNPKIQKSTDPAIPDWKLLGHLEYERLAKTYPVGTLRNILRVVKGRIIEQSLDAAARGEIEQLTTTLLHEFNPGPALFLLQKCDDGASHAERTAARARRHAGKTEGGKPLTTDKTG